MIMMNIIVEIKMTMRLFKIASYLLKKTSQLCERATLTTPGISSCFVLYYVAHAHAVFASGTATVAEGTKLQLRIDRL